MTAPVMDIFESVTLRRAAPPLSSVALLTWHAPRQGDRLVQVYLNRRLYDVSDRPGERSIWLHLDDGPRPAVVELVAVNPDERWVDHAEALAVRNADIRPNAGVALLRDERLPVDSRVRLSVDGEAAHASAMWRLGDSRSGFGAAFGVGGFGHDDATAPGFGRGELGAGPFGQDGAAWRWSSDDLADGQHAIDISVRDGRGRTVAALSEAVDAPISSPPSPPARFWFETGPTGLRLRWSD